MPNAYDVKSHVSAGMSLRPTTWDEEAGTVDVVFSTGARATRLDLYSGEEIEEELGMSPSAVRLGRLNAGAPVLDSHSSGSISDQIGVVVPGSARIEPGGVGVATIQLSSRPSLAGLRADVAAGVVRNISVGYRVHDFVIMQRDGERPVYQVTDWEPFEISLVAVPADPSAQVRSANNLLIGEPRMKSKVAGSSVGGVSEDDTTVDTGSVVTASRVLARANAAKLSAADVADLLDRHATRPMTHAQLVSEVSRRWVEQGTTAPVTPFSGSNRVYDVNPVEALADGLYCRMTNKAPSEQGRPYVGLSFLDVARESLAGRGVDVRRLSVGEIVSRAMHGTSDFTHILSSAFNRFLLDQYEAAETPLKRIARKRDVADFRTVHGVALDNYSQLSEMSENGEIPRGQLGSSQETYRLSTYAKIFSISRQAIINDDLGAFSDMLRLISRAAAETEANLLAGLLTANGGSGVKLSDGNPLFGVARGNKAGSGTVIDVNALSAGRKALRDQKNTDGSPINAQSRFILTGSAKETEAESVVAKLTPAAVSDVNPFAERLEVLVEPRLSGNAWWLFSDPAHFPVLEYAYLTGYEGPQIETRDGWDTLGTDWRVVLDFGCGAIGWLGSYLNEGNT